MGKREKDLNPQRLAAPFRDKAILSYQVSFDHVTDWACSS
jgi:hypothetical protein